MDVVDETKQRAVLIDEAGFVATLEDVSPLFLHAAGNRGVHWGIPPFCSFLSLSAQ